MRGPDNFESIYIHREFVDFRKAVNGLTVIVEEEMQLDPFGKYLFVFSNKRRDRLKILYWDKSGFVLWYKRLEKEKFAWPKKLTEEAIIIDSSRLEMLLDGYNIWKLKPHEELKFKSIS